MLMANAAWSRQISNMAAALNLQVICEEADILIFVELNEANEPFVVIQLQNKAFSDVLCLSILNDHFVLA